MADGSETAISWHDSIAPAFRDGYVRSAGFRDRLRAWGRLIERHARPGDQVIDAGCGAGTLSFEAAKIAAHVHGIDGAERMIDLARASADDHGIANVSFELALFETLSDRAGQYDLALSSSVLEYLPDLTTEIARTRRLAPPGRPTDSIAAQWAVALSPIRSTCLASYRAPALLSPCAPRSDIDPGARDPAATRFYRAGNGLLCRSATAAFHQPLGWWSASSQDHVRDGGGARLIASNLVLERGASFRQKRCDRK